MADGTVRGTFALDTGPAERGVRSYRREAARADVQTRQLGQTMDRTFGQSSVQQINATSRAMRGMGDQAARTRQVVRTQWGGMRRDIDIEARRMEMSIDRVQRKMQSLGRERATPVIDITGVERALARVELLQSRLNSLSRSRATPGVSMAGAAAGGAGGGFGSAAARSRGGGSGMVNMGGVGFAGLRGGTLLAGAALALPAVQALGGAGVAGAASLGSAGMGAGVAAMGGVGPLVAGLATTIPVAKRASEGLKEMKKATDAYTKAVREYGRASKQAAAADRERFRVERANPGAMRAQGMREQFGARWRRASRPALANVYGGIGDVARTAQRGIPGFAQASQVSTGALRQAANRQTSSLTGTESMQTLGIMSRSFARELPTAERSLQNIEFTMMRLARASLPFFHEGNVWVREQTAGWRRGTRDIEGVRQKMRPLVQSAKDWGGLLKASGGLLRSIFRSSAPEGDSMVVRLTDTFERWDEWMERNPNRTRAFFRDTVESTSKMASGIASAVRWLNEMATVLRPVLDRLAQVAELMGSLGLIGAPGALAGLVGAYRGARGAGGAAGGAGGAMFGGGSAAAAAAAAAGVGAGTARVLPSRMGAYSAPGYRGGILQGGATRSYGLGRVAGPVAGAARGAGRAALPVAALFAGLDFASFEGSGWERAQAAASSASMGFVPRPLTGDESLDAGLGTFNRFMRPGRSTEALRSQLQGAQGTLGTFKQAGATGLFGTSNEVRFGGREYKGKAGMAELEEYVRLMKEEVAARREANEQMRRRRNERLDEESKQRAGVFGSKLGATYQAYRKGGMSQESAASSTVGQIRKRLSGTRAAGVETLGESSLAWASAMARENPKLKKQVEQVTSAIEARFRKMGRRVQIVNGDILTGSRREWGQISSAMADPVERARQRVTEDFTAIQQKAVGSLRSMGYSASDARSIVSGLEKGDAGASKDARQGPTGARQRPSVSDANRQKGLARGGTVPGSGMLDTVGMGGAMVAPGETWIANRHTMDKLSRATLPAFGLTAQQLIRGETRRHSAPRTGDAWGSDAARRGKNPSGTATRSAASGLMGANPALGVYARDAAGYGLSVSSGLRPGSITSSGNTSHHSAGWALDLAGPASNMLAYARHAASEYGSRLEELIHSPLGFAIKNGARVPPYAVADHYDHVHLADTNPSGGARGGVDVGGLMGGRVKVRGVGRKQAGVAGVLRQRAGDVYAKGLEKKINERLATSAGPGGGDLSGFSGGGSAEANMRLGRQMMLAAGFGEDQWSALKTLWTKESGWNHMARNPSSGAFGIPQSLPASKMGPAAVGGDPAAQIKWGLGYIRERYGSPAAALAFHGSHNWYARGGKMKWGGAFARGGSMVTDGPTAFVAGEGTRRRERVTVTPATPGQGDGGGPRVVIEKGAINVHVSGGDGQSAGEVADKVGEVIVDRIIEALGAS